MENDILKYALENGIINLSYVQEEIEMKRRKEILKNHPYKIWQGKNGKWYTYLSSDNNEGRVLKKRNTEEKICDLIVEHYSKESIQQEKLEKTMDLNAHEFKTCFESWKQKQISYGISSNTISKYNADYIRYFKDTDFETSDIREINEEVITAFIISRIKKLNLREKAGKALWGYISGVFKSARIARKITENPCDYVDTRVFSKFYNRNQKPLNKRVINDEDLNKLRDKLDDDHKKKPEYIHSYAVELAIYTGMRSGEISALMWNDVDLENGILNISKSERYDRIKKEYFVSGTKNGKVRSFPLSTEAKILLEKVKNVEMLYGYLGEFVFMNKEGRVHGRGISQCMRHKCEQAGIETNGIHSLRRTLNSKLRCDGVSSTVAASLLGHTEEVNELNYTYDITEMEYKIIAVEKASTF